ncbi:MAG TPA: hypothetical protein VLF61_03450, partial [Rhabdochlamydiaceae bacterium]|nr:hypothetical protein [Rhabdochlamydiaceae bacterium]
MKKILFCLSLVFWSCQAFAQETSVLFVLFDAGETHALLPVMKRCESEQLPYQVLAFGTARTLVPNALEIDLPVDSNWQRDVPLAPEEIEKLCLLVQPEVVVSGVASAIQGQLLDAYRGSAKTFAFWD